MKQTAVAVTVTLILGLALFLGWLSLPHSHENLRIRELSTQVESARSRFDEKDNGFSVASLKNLWAADDSFELTGPKRLLGSIVFLGPLPFHGQPVGGQPPPEFGALYDELVELSEKPFFYAGDQVLPEEALHLAGRAILQHAVSQSDPERIIEEIRAVLKLAESIRQGVTVENEIVSLQLENDVFETLCYRFGPSSTLSGKSWLELSSLVLGATPDPQRLSMALAGSHQEIPNRLSTCLAKDDYSEIQLWMDLPGWRTREQRFLENLLADALSEWEKGQLSAPPPVVTDELGLGSLLLGERGLLTSTLTPPFWVAAGKTSSVRARLTGLGLSYALLAFHSEHDAFPGQLSDLRTLNIPLPARDELQSLEVAYDYNSGSPTLSLKHPQGRYTLEHLVLNANWVEIVDDRLVFRLAP